MSNQTAVRKHRAAMRAAGFKLVQMWVPDTKSPKFIAEARRQRDGEEGFRRFPGGARREPLPVLSRRSRRPPSTTTTRRASQPKQRLKTGGGRA